MDKASLLCPGEKLKDGGIGASFSFSIHVVNDPVSNLKPI